MFIQPSLFCIQMHGPCGQILKPDIKFRFITIILLHMQTISPTRPNHFEICKSLLSEYVIHQSTQNIEKAKNQV